MALTPAERQEVLAEIMREYSHRRDQAPVSSKVEFLAALDAVDDWIDANMASFNAALPLPYQTQATARDKAWLFIRVAEKRFNVS